MKRFLFLLSLMLLIPCAAEAQRRTPKAPHEEEFTGLRTAYWLPQDYEYEPKSMPVIIFSHGFHGCNVQSSNLMRALAQEGYAVFAPNHSDANCKSGESNWLAGADEPFRTPERWTDETYRDRLNDMEHLINYLSQHEVFGQPPFNWKQLGVMGHSLGGYTVLGMGGAWPSWKDSRVKGILALSPYSEPYLLKENLKKIDVPVMYQGGTKDSVATSAISKAGGAYEQSNSPKFYVEIDDAGHLAWTDRSKEYNDPISKYSIAFFNYSLKSMPFPPALVKHEGISQFKAH